ncbi:MULTISPECIES: S-adenosyl-l-methionine hydroxide adenosyltransferase family protein [unclassified Oceanispirochaeta]|uniref:SAM hydrolase/SAM-dependent halogenase family protein n=1 Tax=unclassified Oceanispirochaeta TaxID=2635722 RepID=UPI000E09DC60|nr:MULTISPECIES: SAM-dependent chlorinase/fluorinase [unclassified Oceanispirochaeta]MBF9014663.1 SAM-dependent chlorinase/fluorinase [Oceanispirochaeta sp. M2]NPD70919.1 DNA-directed RNA polymerase subunit delta [Oceanispirochaeta sp. M1]RDG33753.1 DNA-directed RNA polymerase subunit delta [Oceanispirochaeta sp. M1]
MDKPILVFQTDFTYKEGAVCSMYGVVKTVDRSLEIITGTHEIPQFDTWSASYRLYQSMKFWPEGTVFVSVVDPGVGTPRKASVALTENGYYIVTPDNGSLTHVDKEFGIKAIREIDEDVNRLKGKGTEEVSIFHGRDLFSYCAAKFASGIISFEEVGPEYSTDEIIRFPILEPTVEGNKISGIFEINDPNFGNLWTNIPLSVFKKAGFDFGDHLNLRICCKGVEKFSEKILFHKSFGFEKKGQPMIYNNELMKISLAVSQGSFIEKYNIGYGSDWTVEFNK